MHEKHTRMIPVAVAMIFLTDDTDLITKNNATNVDLCGPHYR